MGNGVDLNSILATVNKKGCPVDRVTCCVDTAHRYEHVVMVPAKFEQEEHSDHKSICSG